MKEAGIRDARQNLSTLIEQVRQGHEVVITDRGKPVARLVPPLPEKARPYRGLSRFRRKMPKLKSPLSQAVIDGREDRT